MGSNLLGIERNAHLLCLCARLYLCNTAEPAQCFAHALLSGGAVELLFFPGDLKINRLCHAVSPFIYVIPDHVAKTPFFDVEL